MEDPETSEYTEFTDSHTNSDGCQCDECNKNRECHFLIEDIDIFINSLNDWD